MANNNEQILDNKLNYLYNTKNLIKNALKNKGVIVSDSDTFRTYADLIQTLGVGDVLLFETEQEMRSYENPKEGILAIIYNIITNNISVTDYMQYLIFPTEATLAQECTENYNINILDKNNIIVGNVYITPVSFYFNINKTTNIEINYISEDGINYIRTTDISNPIDTNNSIKLDINENNIKWFSPFIKYEIFDFSGLYQYINNDFIYIKDRAEIQLETEQDNISRLIDTIRGE